ncbi:restriction endonuclease subunit S [Marinomonas primoryensis]|uniref:Type I restriction-modification system specificity subunit S n=1 Tax=Marinomonas primoryensis TaxID=178399 RepID=A0A859CV68_9GAMM|nr:restriction endonuclease subunit S [Marinomonas primoryensis]QKK80358.1 type I restriction-modification system specificity subunit S [Marinomonas primoryensis]
MGKYQAYEEYKNSGVEWLGFVPIDWEVTKLKYTVSIFGRIGFRGYTVNDIVDESEGAIVLSPSNVNDDKFTLDKRSYLSWIKYYESPEIMVANGDVLMVKTGSTFGKSTIVKNVDEPMTINPQMALMKSSKIDPRFLSYLLNSKLIKAKIDVSNTGSGMPTMTQENMNGFPVPRPSDDLVIKIANFLDHETAKIDILIEKQQQLIALLKEKRQAVISHAVTKGLNPDAPMRDSGVEWLGEVPEHWEVKKFKFLCDRIIAGPFGSSITKDMYVKHGYKVYGQEQVIPNNFTIGDYYINEKNYLELSRYIVGEGEILISCVGTFGKIAVFPKGAEPGIINPRLIKAEISQDHDPYYIRELLKSEMVFKQFELLSRGGTMGVINIAILNEILASVPPASEQSEIVDYINLQKEKFSNLIDKANNAVVLLQERRTALISAAVTGKIDVRNWTPD